MRAATRFLLLWLLCGPACASVTTADAAMAAELSAEAGATPVVATPPPAEPPYAARLRADARKVLQGPDFRRSETSLQPVARDWLRKWLNRKEAKPEKPVDLSTLALLADVFKFLAVALLALGLGWLLWRGWQWLAPQVGASRPAPGRAAPEVASRALPAATLPDAVSAAALAAWRGGDATQAMSLLYRGAVRDLATRHHVALPASATEGECLRAARQSDADVVAAGFAPIVKAWMALAYARRPPADFDALLALYRRYFEAPPGEAP
ncbi:MAG: 5-nucleotidase/2,3-cyclic phosphodiesterase and related esterase [Moraxellaceae bacterium]|jgi:hypothetical protein|nr:5-nucleotidase/2,3-cyclic phosphodiesterase and related esterase [Moraxellaceae bacterium]